MGNTAESFGFQQDNVPSARLWAQGCFPTLLLVLEHGKGKLQGEERRKGRRLGGDG